MDIDCGGFLVTNLQQAISSGAVSQADIDTALTNQFMVQFRLGLFDPVDKQPYKALGAKVPTQTTRPTHTIRHL